MAVGLFWGLGALLAFTTGWWISQPLFEATSTRRISTSMAIILLATIPLAAGGVYLALGTPQAPDQPLTPRLQGRLEDLPPAAMLARLENELHTRPDDARGWHLLARLRASLGAHEQAADAWRQVIDLQGGNSEAFAGLAQALIESEDGVVSQPAMHLLDEALRLQPDNMIARFWRALAWQQQGEDSKARRLWQAMRDDLPDDAPLADMLDRQLQNIQ